MLFYKFQATNTRKHGFHMLRHICLWSGLHLGFWICTKIMHSIYECSLHILCCHILYAQFIWSHQNYTLSSIKHGTSLQTHVRSCWHKSRTAHKDFSRYQVTILWGGGKVIFPEERRRKKEETMCVYSCKSLIMHVYLWEVKTQVKQAQCTTAAGYRLQQFNLTMQLLSVHLLAVRN